MSDSLDLSVRFTRRTATVTTSAPEAAWQRAISGKLRYLPVPTNRREWKVRPAMVRVSIIQFYSLSSILFLPSRGARGLRRFRFQRDIGWKPAVEPLPVVAARGRRLVNS